MLTFGEKKRILESKYKSNETKCKEVCCFYLSSNSFNMLEMPATAKVIPTDGTSISMRSITEDIHKLPLDKMFQDVHL